MPSHADPRDFEGRVALDSQGHRIGRVEVVYVDPESMLLQWGLVRTGLLGTPVIIPLVQVSEAGGSFSIPHARGQIALAPRVNPRRGFLSEAEEEELARHYDLGYSRATSASGLVEPAHPQAIPEAEAPPPHPEDEDGADLLPSEDRLALRLVQQPQERVRLVKRVVREPASTTASVRREEICIERGPVTVPTEGLDATAAPLREEERGVMLMRQEAVVEKRIEAVERIRLGRNVAVEELTIHAELRPTPIEGERAAAPGLPE